MNFLNIEQDEVNKLKRVIQSLQLDKIKPVFKNIHNRLKEVECSSARDKDDKGRKDSARILIKQLIDSQQFCIQDSFGNQITDTADVDEVSDYNYIRIYNHKDGYESEDCNPIQNLSKRFLDQNVKLLIL